MALSAVFGEQKFNVGDTVNVFEKLKEKDKIRLHAFEGIVIAIRGREERKSFVVRRKAIGGIFVERIWPLNCPTIEKITVKKGTKKIKVRRAKLYFLRKNKS